MTDDSEQLKYRWIAGQGNAFGAPGLPPRWTSSEKDVVGTAYSIASRLWFTVSHGIVDEIYYPTIDRPQTRDLGLLITDGETFAHEEKRNLDHSFEYITKCAPAVRLTNRDPEGRYTIIKEVLSDPHMPVLLMHVKVEAAPEVLQKLRVYPLLAPHMEVGGARNSARVLDVAGRRVVLAWKEGTDERTALAFAADCNFDRVSCGYVGASDGWQDVMTHNGMQWEFGSALDGNIAVMGEIPLARTSEFTVAVGFGTGHHAALTAAMGALSTPFAKQQERFLEQWERVSVPAVLAKKASDKGRLLRSSYGMLLAHEDKTFAGAFIASASIPWGQSKGDADLGGYHLVWTRDMVHTATALLSCGRVETARRALIYLACTQEPDGGFAQNFWVDGTPYWSGLQLDETAFPIVLAWRLWKAEPGTFDLFPFVERAAGFLVRHAPVTQEERWEELAGYSPSTLAIVISALVCAGEIARAYAANELASFLEEQADWLESHLEDWTVTNEGVLLPSVKRHYMRIRPPEKGDPYTKEGAGTEIIHIANRAPGEKADFEAREIIDAGFLELVRYGVRAADDQLMIDSLKVVDAVIKRDLPEGAGYRRYNHDGYGQRADGGPFDGWGQGRCWPLLSGERAHYEIAAGGKPKPLLHLMEQACSAGGMLPEQLWDAADLPEHGMYCGRPSGSAMPLVWAHAEYVKLLKSMLDGEVFDRIPVVAERYGRKKREGAVEVWRQDRAVRSMGRNRRLRVECDRRFHLVWSADDWATTHRTESTAVGVAGFFADAEPGSGEKLSFTLFWPESNHWAGRNFDVLVGD